MSLFTNNQWIESKGKPFSSFDSSSHNKVWHGFSATGGEVDAIVANAKRAFEEWSKESLELRSDCLKRFKSVVENKQNSLAKAISQETGKPLWDSLNEIKSVINKVPLSLEAYHERCREKAYLTQQGKAVVRYKPHGVLGILGPFNFPCHLPHGHIIPALLAGNTIVFKPSELTPLCAHLMMECWQEANLPAGVVNMVQGAHETGSALCKNHMINGILFTGSLETGLSLMQQFASQPEKILALEMGGNNPLVVSDISNLEATAAHIIQSAYLSSGQRCTCARRLIIVESQNTPKLLAILTDMIINLSVGLYTQIPEPFMGPVIHARQAEHLLKIQYELQGHGGIILHEMKQLKPVEFPALLSPGLIDTTQIKHHADKEIFGPLLQIIRVKTFASALAEANQTKYGLSSGLLSDDPNEYEIFLNGAEAGIVNWNTPLTGASSASPFGGIKGSGNFRPSAYCAADYCAYPVSSFESSLLTPPSMLPPGFPFLKNQEIKK